MQTHDLVQGSPEWHAYRREHFNASDAPAMMGCSPYKTRAQLLREMATGISPEVDAATQRRFDDGHRFEALGLPLAEAIVGATLYPVTGSEGKLSASFDGLTLAEDVAYEHKSLNAELRQCMHSHVTGRDLPIHYRVQMEQQLLVSGAERCLFMASKWADEAKLIEARECWYLPDPELRAQIVAGWEQFAADLAAYVPPQAAAPQATGKAPNSLPALRIEVSGAVTASNLDEFKQTALEAINGVNRELKTDQDFADAEKSVKWCADVEDRLQAAKRHALSQTASIDDLFRTMDDIGAEARRVRLDLEKLVKARKESIRGEIVSNGGRLLAEHIRSLNARLGHDYMPTVPADFATVIKSKRTIESIQDAIDTELARAKIAANEVADRITLNMRAIDTAATEAPVFADVRNLVLKAPDDLGAVITSRVDAYKADQAKRIAEEVERMKSAEEARAKALLEAQHPQQVLKAELVTADATDRGTAVMASPRVGAMGAGQAADAAPSVVLSDLPTLNIGQINMRLRGPSINAAFIADVLGIPSAGRDKNAVLFNESQWPAIKAGLLKHIQGLQ